MQIVVLIGIIIALSTLEMFQVEPGVFPAAGAGWLAVSLAVYLLVTTAAAALHARGCIRRLRVAAGLPNKVLRQHGRGAMVLRGWVLLGLAGVMVCGGARWISAHLAHLPLLDKLAAMGPLLAAVYIVWLLDYPFYRAARLRCAGPAETLTARPYWTLGEYLNFNTRHHVLFILAPVGMILLARDLLALFVPQWLGGSPAADYVMLAAMIGSSGLVFLLAPVLVVRIWRTRRLPDGPLRANLLAMCDRLKLKVRELRIWESGGMIANAGVMGLLGPVRYVLLSDALLARMNPREVKAVFAHEAGHILSHHIFYSVLFALAATGLAAVAASAAGVLLGVADWMSQLLAIGLVAAAWAFGFGWLSRRFERQSDVTAAWAMSREFDERPDSDDRVTPEGAASFAVALQHVARLNGIPAEQFNWRHGSINRRVSYILWLGSTGGGRQAIDRTVGAAKAGLWLAFLVAGALNVTLFMLSAGV